MAKFSKDKQPTSNGRKKGGVNKTTQLMRDATPEILSALIEQAKEGDIQAATLVLKHSLPPVRPEHARFNIELKDDMTFFDKAQAIMDSALAGECCPDMAIKMISAMGALSNSLVLDTSVRVNQLNSLPLNERLDLM